MFEVNTSLSYLSCTRNQHWARRLFRQALWRGALRRVALRLLGRATELRSLEDAATQRRGARVHVVSLSEIVGSEGRSTDFDAAFAPLHGHTKARWIRVALARRGGLTLPPVLLVRAVDGYYVRDGHHRISVARALGEAFIDAELA